MFDNELIRKCRRDTPACEKFIHFNNAGSSLPPRQVTTAMMDYLDLESKIGGYEAAEIKEKEINEFYILMARFIHCKGHNIAYTYNATDSYSRALSSIPLEKDDILLTSINDYISNQIAFLSIQKRFGIKIVRVPDYETGGIHVEIAERLIRSLRPKIVAVTHVPTNSGLIQDVAAIGRICKDFGIWYIVDACQSVGQLKINVEDIGCDFLSATFRKFLRGPRGAGFLYVSDRALKKGLEPLFIDMRGADWVQADVYKAQATARRFELWEFPYALLMGAKTSIHYATEIGIEKIEKRTRKLSEILREKLRKFDQVRVLDKGVKLSGIVTFWVQGWDPDSLKAELDKRKVNSSISLREYALMDFEEKKVDWAIRLSPHYYNTEEEIDKFIGALEEILAGDKND